MIDILTIQADDPNVLSLYHKQKLEFHFQQKSDNDFVMFLLDTAMRVTSVGTTPVLSNVPVDADLEEASGSVRYNFGRTLEPGDYLEVYGTYVTGTSRFNVNIRDDNGNYLLCVDFRPTSAVVLNSYNWGWETGVRPGGT
jgi:hypothetical protein